MSLKLNEEVLPSQEYYGRNTEQMPRLIADGRVPLSAAGLMLKRLDVLSAGYSAEVRDAWWDNYFDTGDAVSRNQEGNVKIELDSQIIMQINKKSELKNSALILSNETYNAITPALGLTKAEAEKYFKDSFTEQGVNQSPVWQALARDKELLKEYSHQVFALAKQKFNYDKNMGLYLSSAEKVPTMRLWSVWGLVGRSNAGCRYGLDGYYGRLVGVRRENVAEGDTQKMHERSSAPQTSSVDLEQRVKK